MRRAVPDPVPNPPREAEKRVSPAWVLGEGLLLPRSEADAADMILPQPPETQEPQVHVLGQAMRRLAERFRLSVAAARGALLHLPGSPRWARILLALPAERCESCTGRGRGCSTGSADSVQGRGVRVPGGSLLH